MSTKNQTVITKASGQLATFSAQKLKRSLLNVGATEDLAESIVGEIQLKLYARMSTKKIYHIAFNRFKNISILENNIVLCKEICDNENYLDTSSIESSQIKSILKESRQLCN